MLKLKASKAFSPLLSQKDFSFSAVYLLKPVRSRNGHVFSRAASHFLYSLLGTTCTRLQTNTLTVLPLSICRLPRVGIVIGKVRPAFLPFEEALP